MKIVYVGSFAESWSTETYIARALARAGHDVQRIEESAADHAQIVSFCEAQQPDILLGAKWRFHEANIGWPEAAGPIVKLFDAVRSHVRCIATWLFDLLASKFSVARFEWARRVSEACDVFATTDGHTAPSLANSIVIRQGVPDDVDQSVPWEPEEYRGDVLFLGTSYRERYDLVQALGAAFGNRFRAVNDCRGPALTRLVRAYRIVIGPQYPFYPGYWSNRLYVVTGHGGLFAAPAVPGMQGDGWMACINYLPLPHDIQSYVAKLREYASVYDAGQLEAVRRSGFEHANRACSYDRRVAELLTAAEQ